MAGFNLRDYQAELEAKIYTAWQSYTTVLAVCPTGGGKTVIFSKIAADHVGAAALVVHRREIVSQISVSLARMGVKHRIVGSAKSVKTIRRRHIKALGKSFVDQQALVGVASVQTLTSKSSQNDPGIQRWAEQVTLAVYDEGHHYVATGTWAKGVEMFVNVKRRLMVTATPDRADGQGMGDHANGGSGYCETMVEGPTTQWLIDSGFLTPFVYKCPETDLDVRGLAVTASGDFNAKALRARVVDSHIVGDVVQHYHVHASGLQTIVFASDVETAQEMAAEFRRRGYTAVALSGQTEQGERDHELERFENNQTQVLVNVDLFDEGFDVPAVECVLMARPTESLGKFLQMVGRALRILEGKARAVIIDAVRNWERHGLPTWPRQWSLAGRPKGERVDADVIPLVSCRECTQPYEAFYKACPYCGHVHQPPERSEPAHVDGDLIELDMEAMAALFKKIERADMSDDEYRRGQIARNVPPIGRGPDLKRHQAAKYRRGVLKELVGWWVGMQPDDRTMSEKHRRFFHRFGIDIATAFTLDVKETDKLIENISRKFAADMDKGQHNASI